jgi:DNA-binding transcriptional regulator YhcF (GntR family)
MSTQTRSSSTAQPRNAFEIARDEFLRPIKRDRKLPRNAYIVADEIAHFFNREHFNAAEELRAWPSIERLVSATNLSRRTIIRIIATLEKAGYIEVERAHGRGKNNRYRGLKKVPDAATDSAWEKVPHCAVKGAKPGSKKVPDVAPDSLNRPPERPCEGKDSPSSPSSVESQCQPQSEFTGAAQKKHGATSHSEAKTRCRPPKTPDSFEGDFDGFWTAYPLKNDRGAARRAYSIARRNVSAETILDGATRYAAERNAQNPKFTKSAANWLNAEAWGNEPAPPMNAPPRSHRGGTVLDDFESLDAYVRAGMNQP